MSRELRVTYASAAANLYAIIRRSSDGYVWSTVSSAFAAWSDGSIADYDIALTDRGGDLYDGDIPTALPAGDFTFGYYERSGATPAITDLLLTTEARHWNGAVLTSDSDIDLSAYALTTLDNQKRYQRIEDSEDDTLITQLINAVSKEIERVCGIEFVARDRRERLNGVGQRRLSLKQFPVIGLHRMSWGNGQAMSVTYAGSAIRAEVGVTDSGVRISSTSTAGSITTNSLLFTDYPSLSVLAVAINLVSGWTATVQNNTASADLNPLGGQDAKSKTVYLTYPDRADINYTVDYSAGLIELAGSNGWGGGNVRPMYGRPTGYEGQSVMPCGHQYILVQYRAGYETVPADVELQCNRMVTDAYNEGFTARNVTMASIGPYTWKASADQVADIKTSLSHYIDISRMMGAA